jgi:serine/threonine-protein kinase
MFGGDSGRAAIRGLCIGGARELDSRANGMPALTSETLLAELRRLKLLTDEAAAAVATAALVQKLPPERWTRLLVQVGLTKFQARAAIEGKAAKLNFGPYVLLDRIGEGGMGTVYKARHARLGRIDAVKVLRADKVGSPTVARRFRREIEVMSRLEHPHIVRAYDAGQVGPQLYLATEFVDGTDLATVVTARGPLSAADACLVLYQSALALRHIHEKGFVHRDMKPSNLIRDRATGAVKILDLGLSGFNRSALETTPPLALTRDGVVLGTPDYMAPEQVQNPHRVDIRADLYGLGCTVYFLLTGQPPFDGSAVEKMYKHGFSPPPALVLPNGLVPPPGLAEIIARLMAKAAGDRFQTPQELIDALLAIRPGAGEPPRESPAPLATRTPVAVDSPLDPTGFGHILSDDVSNDTPAPRTPREARGGIPRSWVAAAGVFLLFGLGFLAAALYFSSRR